MNIPPEVVEVAVALGTPATVVAASKPIAKLIETVSPAFGVIYDPLKKIIDAKVQVKVDKIKALGEIENAEAVERYKLELLKTREGRAEQRTKYIEEKQQENLEDTIREAVEHLPEEVSEEKVDEDWFFQWMKNAQEISEKQMQTLWAKILAGEITKPGSFSLRTLQFIKTIDKDEATLFNHFCNYLFKAEREFILCITDEVEEYLKSKKLNFYAFQQLESMGLIAPGSFTKSEGVVDLIEVTKDYDGLEFLYGNAHYHLVPVDKSKPSNLKTVWLTKVGNDLAKLRDFEADLEFITVLQTSLNDENINLQAGELLAEITADNF